MSYKKSSPIRHVGAKNLIIKNLLIISGDKIAIELQNCTNIRIVNCRIIDGKHKNGGVYLYKCHNVTIENCFISNVKSGIIASTSSAVYIHSNQFLNMRGPSNGVVKLGQFVQFRECFGAGNKITKNLMENIFGFSDPEDAINIYKSNGDPKSPIEISYNKIKGGGPSASGGGIVLGDDGGSYQVARENVLVNPGQYGIAIAGGHNMTLKDNIVFGKKQHFTNVGIVANDWYNGKPTDIEISGNRVNFTAAGDFPNAMWNSGNLGKIKGIETNVLNDSTLTESVLPERLIKV